MIPQQLKFSGIRDYRPTNLRFYSATNHVLITGPNGAGKSTISFCLGAVLYSGKVDIEGLKSRNLSLNETWRATISLLFKNEGTSRIDGPLWIEFTLKIEQELGQPIKRVYSIAEGETENDLAITKTYRSGDINKQNFTQYHEDLQLKYKIQPDKFYLIWYQQEVNQFAVMTPEERFRIFSEMHGIDQTQRAWEESLEQVRDARESLIAATQDQRNHQHKLSFAKNELDLFIDNQQRLKSNGTKLVMATRSLQTLNQLERAEMINHRESLLYDAETLLEEQEELLHKEEIEKERLQSIIIEEDELQKRLDEEENRLEKVREAKRTSEEELDILKDELADLSGKARYLRYDQEETNQRLRTATLTVSTSEQKLINLSTEKKQLEDKKNKLMEDKIKLEQESEQWKKNFTRYNSLLTRYTSTYHVQQRINEFKIQTTQLFNQINTLKEREKQLDTELNLLNTRRIESPRQQQSLKQLTQQGIRGFTLRELVELEPDASIEAEDKLNSIKYTIFYDAKPIQVPNDLYHVSLKTLVPDRLVTSLPELQLLTKQGLSLEEQNLASRVLWWIDQFFSGNFPSIRQKQLIDDRGIRGPQESDAYILSEKAVEKRKETVIRERKQVIERNVKYKAKYDADIADMQELHSIIQQVKEAEAFSLTQSKQHERLEYITNIEKQLNLIKNQGEHLEQEQESTHGRHQQALVEQREHQKDVDIYAQLGEQAKKFERLQQLEKDAAEFERNIDRIRRIRKDMNDELDELKNSRKKMERILMEVDDNLIKMNRTHEQVHRQIVVKSDDIDLCTQSLIKNEQALEELRALIPEWYEEAEKESIMQISRAQLEQNRGEAEIHFNLARTQAGINQEAVQNYNMLKIEFDRKQEDLERATYLLEENELRAQNLEDRLDTTINQNVLNIRNLFQTYIGLFQFEGQIEHEKVQDRRGRIHFKLYIKARKAGHRGTMEDVSVKARGGRVGKGVSGGEESLSSLLFALALLQSLSNRPGFIVLDEFDSALDEERKAKVFQLYAKELKRKLIILSPKSHDDAYYNEFSIVHVVSHDPLIPESKVKGVRVERLLNNAPR
ncbi:chromosome segregation protein SMC [Bacillus sp. NEB1478]|uniref:chromosome segregation protein SMC n=1 Tax=Bacillus sp. NEB1478 TaxID=3073816 RepID=UPI002872D8A1|nr:chromosome segregation protein SMC [Bacillus sp. NEB1478]WNB92120.1 chromosome segregation protein SMC [Bacillus sp. NEB1478]